MRTHLLFSAGLALACLVLPPLDAQPAASGSIEVSAEAPAISPAPTAGRSSLDAEAIAASGASSLVEVLGLLPGISVSANGSSGAQAALSIRGSTTNQVLVLVDGVPASDPSTGLADLSRLGLSPADLASVEVVRGGSSAQYGPDAVGGVVIITTKKPAKGLARPLLQLAVANTARAPFASVEGSGFSATDAGPDALSLVDGQEASLSLSLPGGLVLGLGGERSANAFLYRDSSGVRRSRDNADLLSGRASLAWRGGLGRGNLDAWLGTEVRSLGVPGPTGAPTPDARQDDAQLRASLAWATDAFFSDRVAFKTTAYGLASRTAYRESPSLAEDRSLASRLGIDSAWSILLGPRVNLGAGLSGRYEGLDSSNVVDSDGSAPRRLALGAYLEPRLDLGQWTLVPAARLDWTSDFSSGFSFSLGAARTLTKELSLSANASTAYRAPSFDDLWWPAAAGVAGNPDLRPERSWGGDLGLKWARDDFSLSASVYARYIEDVILWQEGTDTIWRPSNYGSALYPGLEAEASLSGTGPWSARLAWRYIHSYVLSGGLSLSDDLRVPMVPEQAFNLGVARESGRFSAGLDLDYSGLRYLTMANVAIESAHLVANAHLRWDLGSGRVLTLDGLNLLDESYESVQGYPMPGFSLRLGFEARMGG